MPQRRKYKYYLRKLYSLDKFPKKILRLNKKKWKFLKKRIKKLEQFRWRYSKRRQKKVKRYKNKFKFPDLLKTFVNRRYEQKIRYNYSANLVLKRLFLIYSNFNTRQVLFKKNTLLLIKKQFFENLFAKNFYNVSNLIFLLLFTSSRLESKKFIENKKVLINDKNTIKNRKAFLGDILKLNLSSFKYVKNKRKNTRVRKVYPHLEIDYYSQNIIVTKGIKNNSRYDYCYYISNPNLENIVKY